VPILILANKQDIKNSILPTEMHSELGIDLLPSDFKQRVFVNGTSAKTGVGLKESFEWMVE
jgi:hypothetical protein